MNIDDDDLTSTGASLPLPVAVHGRTVATFTPTRHVSPAEAWQPFMRPTSMTSDGNQGSPLGSLRSALPPGQSIEHEPVDAAERGAQNTAQAAAKAASHIEAGNAIRSALRPGV